MQIDQSDLPFFTRFHHPVSSVRVLVSPSRTRQEYKRECDINYILARVGAGLQQLVPPDAAYVDVSEIPADYQECLAKIADTAERFAALPSALRERFENNPSKLLAFLANESNRAEAEKLGLIISKSAAQAAAEPPKDEKHENPKD